MSDNDPEAIVGATAWLYALAEDDPRRAELSAAKTTNDRYVHDISAMAGKNFTPQVGRLRLEVALDLLLSPDDRMTFELEYEARIATALKKTLDTARAQLEERDRQVRMQTLLHGAPRANGHRPGR
jgi:hypothetical protein